jgi:hypothetical protein
MISAWLLQSYSSQDQDEESVYQVYPVYRELRSPNLTIPQKRSAPETCSVEGRSMCNVNFAYEAEESLHKYTLLEVGSRGVTDDDRSVMRAA